MKSEFNPIRLRRARLLRGLTTTELAEKVGVKRQSISQYETSKNPPGADTLLKISNVLEIPWVFFHENDEHEVKLENIFYRSLTSARKFDLEIQDEKLKLFSQLYHIIEKDIKFPKLSINREKYWNLTPEEAASELRNEWNLGDGPIKNIVVLLEKNGFVLSALKTNGVVIDAFGGGESVNDQDYYFIMLGDDKMSAARRQFDVAHELGHAILHDWSLERNEIDPKLHKKMENEADRFASAFLLPESSFRKDISYSKKLDYYVELKKKWKVSIAAMIMRSKALGELNSNQTSYLYRQISSRGWRKREPLDDVVRMQNPALLLKAVEMLIVNDRYDEVSFVKNFSKNGLTIGYKDVESILNLPIDFLKPKHEDIGVVIDLKSEIELKRQSKQKDHA